jgi:hypothetical protein
MAEIVIHTLIHGARAAAHFFSVTRSHGRSPPSEMSHPQKRKFPQKGGGVRSRASASNALFAPGCPNLAARW